MHRDGRGRKDSQGQLDKEVRKAPLGHRGLQVQRVLRDLQDSLEHKASRDLKVRRGGQECRDQLELRLQPVHEGLKDLQVVQGLTGQQVLQELRALQDLQGYRGIPEYRD